MHSGAPKPQEDFEKELIQEEMAMSEQVEPVDDSRLMIQNLEESSAQLQETADLGNIQIEAKPSPKQTSGANTVKHDMQQ